MPPHHQNFNKRLVKTPKLYFHDTGLATWLLCIESSSQLTNHPQRGALFETWVVADYLKKRLNTALPSNLSFWRDRSGHEVDLLVEQGGQLQAIEIKSGATTISAWYALDPKLVLSMIAVESNFQTHAQSPKAAMGLMQLIPDSAERFNVRNAFDESLTLASPWLAAGGL